MADGRMKPSGGKGFPTACHQQINISIGIRNKSAIFSRRFLQPPDGSGFRNLNPPL